MQNNIFNRFLVYCCIELLVYLNLNLNCIYYKTIKLNELIYNMNENLFNFIIPFMRFLVISRGTNTLIKKHKCWPLLIWFYLCNRKWKTFTIANVIKQVKPTFSY